MTAAWTIENNVGRLIEIRMQSLQTLAEVQQFWRSFGEVVNQLPAPSFVICTDVHQASVFPPDVADAMIAGMQRDNPRLERNGFLLGASAVFTLQVERMIREAHSPRCRSFREPIGLVHWLEEVLTGTESLALRRFLGVR
jgi:hypothetical protein